MAPASDPEAILARMIGRRVVAIEQAFYVFRGAIDQAHCLLQMRLDNGVTVHFWTRADGETVRIVATPWDDPFAEPLSAENRAFVEQSGKWTLFDTSTTPEMAPLRGQRIRQVFLVYDQRGAKRGVQVETGAAVLTYLVSGDEGFIVHGPATDDTHEHFDLVPVASHSA